MEYHAGVYAGLLNGMDVEGTLELTADRNRNEVSALSSVHLNGIQVSEHALARSELLRDVRSMQGRAQLAVTPEAFYKWASFDMTATPPGTPADLAELLRVRSIFASEPS